MKVYLDNCCFNRPYDDQTFSIIWLESRAKLIIQDNIRSGQYDLVWSFILEFENDANPHPYQKESISQWKSLAAKYVESSESVRVLAKFFVGDLKIKSKDALHLACAIYSKCEYFITTDKILLKKTTGLVEIQIVNPIEFLQKLEGE